MTPRLRRSSARAFVSLAALTAAASSGCSAGAKTGRVCDSTAACGAELCVVGRCRPADSLPSPADSLRVLLPPRDVAVLTRGGPRGGGAALPEAIALGRKDSGNVVILLRFSATWRDDAEIASAFIVLAPTNGSLPGRRPAAVEVARILDTWSSSTVTWGRQPRLSLPEKAGLIRTRTSVPTRIDVTSLVRDWPKRRPDDNGIALLIEGNDDGVGATYSMGITEGVGPILEVYVR